MGRPKGVKNKQETIPELQLSDEERLELLAKILVDTFDQMEHKGDAHA